MLCGEKEGQQNGVRNFRKKILNKVELVKNRVPAAPPKGIRRCGMEEGQWSGRKFRGQRNWRKAEFAPTCAGHNSPADGLEGKVKYWR